MGTEVILSTKVILGKGTEARPLTGTQIQSRDRDIPMNPIRPHSTQECPKTRDRPRLKPQTQLKAVMHRGEPESYLDILNPQPFTLNPQPSTLHTAAGINQIHEPTSDPFDEEVALAEAAAGLRHDLLEPRRRLEKHDLPLHRAPVLV